MSDDAEVLLVIVGAGASYDCLPKWDVGNTSQYVPLRGFDSRPLSDVRPPLTKDLVKDTPFVNEIISRYDDCRPVVDYLRHALTGMPSAPSLEEALATYRERQDRDPTVGAHMVAIRLFLRDLLTECGKYMLSPQFSGGLTNYTTLVRILHDWAVDRNAYVAFVSFNYDILLDQACSDHWRLDLGSASAYIEKHPYACLLKPHGSIQWSWPTSTTKTADPSAYARSAIAHGRESDVDTSDFDRVPWMLGAVGGSVRYGVPALALPIVRKQDFAWPHAHRLHLVDTLAKRVSRVLTIGWRAAEDHFLVLLPQLVREGAKYVIVTGGEAADQDRNFIEQQFVKLGIPSGQAERSGAGFTGFLKEDSLSWLLT